MREYQRDNGRERKPARRFGGGFGGDRQRGRFGGRAEGRFERYAERSNRQPPEMHKVICDKCGKECTVPFKPTSSKPVYCSDCFRKKDDSFTKVDTESKAISNLSAEDIAKIHQKLDKIMQALKIE